jgi:hypothetical protein
MPVRQKIISCKTLPVRGEPGRVYRLPAPEFFLALDDGTFAPLNRIFSIPALRSRLIRMVDSAPSKRDLFEACMREAGPQKLVAGGVYQGEILSVRFLPTHCVGLLRAYAYLYGTPPPRQSRMHKFVFEASQGRRLCVGESVRFQLVQEKKSLIARIL